MVKKEMVRSPAFLKISPDIKRSQQCYKVQSAWPRYKSLQKVKEFNHNSKHLSLKLSKTTIFVPFGFYWFNIKVMLTPLSYISNNLIPHFPK